MKKGKQILILVLCASLLSCKGYIQEKEIKKSVPKFTQTEKGVPLPKPSRVINDFGQVFKESQQTELNKLISDYRINTTKEIAIVTVNTIKPYKDIQKYATDLGNDWEVGHPKRNNGLIIVLCKPCKQIGIATGIGTEQILTDKICKEVIEKTIIPEFKNGKFYTGIKNGVIKLIEKWNI